MPLNIEQIQPFIAKINGVEFNSEMQFDTTKYILQMIEYELKAEITTQFVKDIKQLILDLLLTSELTYSDIEGILRDCLKTLNHSTRYSSIFRTWKIVPNTSTINLHELHIERYNNDNYFTMDLRFLHNDYRYSPSGIAWAR